MLARLPYRVQIPLGLSLAVLVAALLVTAVAAHISAGRARDATVAAVDRTALLVSAQALPLLATDDTWRVFAMLRNTAAVLPGAEAGHSRVAVLDAQGRVFAASEPAVLETDRILLGQRLRSQPLPPPAAVTQRTRVDYEGGALALIDPIRSEDNQVMGFSYVEVDAPVFAPDWAVLSQPALLGVALAVTFLIPIGWWIGRRMTRPIARVAKVIERIGREDPNRLHLALPSTRDPELGRINAAVERLLAEMQVRRRAEQRALSAERMAAVGRMTAAVAHEINNPLGGLLNATRTLTVHGASEETRGKTLDLLQRGLLQIHTTVAALLPQARIEDRPLEIGDLEDVATLVEPATSDERSPLTTHAEVESAMRVPSGVMRQVMLNLLLNARKAAGREGSVDAHLYADAEVVRLTVTNTGPRLTRSVLEQSIAANGGNDPRGFGLWVCSEIASQFAGGFHLDESLLSGTRLVFWMPNRERHEEPATD